MTGRTKLLLFKEKDYCFILQPKADSQASKIPFKITDGSALMSFIVRQTKTNKTQILHRVSIKKFVLKTPLEDKYAGEKLLPDTNTNMLTRMR